MDSSKVKILVMLKDQFEHQSITEVLSKYMPRMYSAFNEKEGLCLINSVENLDMVILDAQFSHEALQNIIHQSQSLSFDTHFIISAIGSANHPDIGAFWDIDADISTAISLNDIAIEVEEKIQMKHIEPTKLKTVDLQPGVPNRPKVSVIIPTLNEAKNLPYLIPYLPMDWIDEVVLVDGRSTDNTIEVAKELLPSIVVIEEKRKGKGIAMQTGFNSATGDILITLDADGSNDPREIPRMVTALLEGADMVKGTRFSTGGGTNDMTLIRKLGNKGLIVLTNILFGASFSDLCYGYHAFWRHCLDYLDLEDQTGFEIDTGMYIQAWRNHLKLVETPSFEGYRFHGYGKLQTFKDGWRVLKQIITEKQSQLQADPLEEYMGFRGANPIHISPPSYKDIYSDFYRLAFSKNLHYQKNTGQFPENGKFDPVSLENIRALFQMFYMASSVSRFEYFDQEKLLANILSEVVGILEASSGTITVLDEKGLPHESYMIYDNKVVPVPVGQISDTFEKGLAGWVVKNQQPVLLKNTDEDERWVKRSYENSTPSPRSALSVPLTARNSVVGVLTLSRPQMKQFTFDDLIVANSITV